MAKHRSNPFKKTVRTGKPLPRVKQRQLAEPLAAPLQSADRSVTGVVTDIAKAKWSRMSTTEKMKAGGIAALCLFIITR